LLFKGAHRDIDFVSQFDEKLPPFRFDADQIRRVMTNLLDNAVSALEAHKEKNPELHPRIKLKTQFGEELQLVRIEVEDNGGGIPLSMKDRLFEPYVTTKSNGTGLGLAISRRMVEDHHGFMRAFSDNESFTRFVIELPIVKV